MKLTSFAAIALVACSHSQPAPSAAKDTELTHTFRIGELTAVALKDGVLAAPNDGKMLYKDHPVAEVSAALAAGGAPTDHFELSIDPLLVKDGAKLLLFDTGLNGQMPQMAKSGWLTKALAEAGIDPAKVTDIFISHSHGDHVGGLAGFPNAAIHMSKPEWELMQKNPQEKDLVAAVSSKVQPFEPGAQILPEVKAIATPGHTPGHSAYEISSNGEKLLYVGDIVHHYVLSVQHPDWSIAFDQDKDAAQAVRQKTLADAAQSGELVYAVHFPFPNLGHIRKQGDKLVWEPL
jgi:glyoxylase-like metal-dependent hydrolase (beta-lactamase superfamily II)